MKLGMERLLRREQEQEDKELKKIAFIAPSLCTFGGEQRVTAMIASELVKEYEVTAYTWDQEKHIKNAAFKRSDKIKLKYFNVQTGKIDWTLRRIIRVLNRKTGCFNSKKFAQMMCDMYYPPRSRQWLIDEINREQYDVVIGVSGYDSILLGDIADQITAKTIGWQHNSYEAYFETKGLYYWNQFHMFKETVNKLDRCFVLNSYIARRYVESFGKKCDVFYNPRSFQSEKKAELEQPVFVSCGEFNYRKGFDYLIDAMKVYVDLAREQGVIPWKLRMLGDGATRVEIESKIEKYGISEYIDLVGNVKNVKEQMAECSCFVLSSRWEGFPMVGTEALEMGLPTISFDITAMHPLVTDGVEGLLVKAYDCQEFGRAMLKLSQDEALRKSMGKAAANKAKEFALDYIMEQWYKTLEEIIE